MNLEFIVLKSFFNTSDTDQKRFYPSSFREIRVFRGFQIVQRRN